MSASNKYFCSQTIHFVAHIGASEARNGRTIPPTPGTSLSEIRKFTVYVTSSVITFIPS